MDVCRSAGLKHSTHIGKMWIDQSSNTSWNDFIVPFTKFHVVSGIVVFIVQSSMSTSVVSSPFRFTFRFFLSLPLCKQWHNEHEQDESCTFISMVPVVSAQSALLGLVFDSQCPILSKGTIAYNIFEHSSREEHQLFMPFLCIFGRRQFVLRFSFQRFFSLFEDPSLITCIFVGY